MRPRRRSHCHLAAFLPGLGHYRIHKAREYALLLARSLTRTI